MLKRTRPTACASLIVGSMIRFRDVGDSDRIPARHDGHAESIDLSGGVHQGVYRTRIGWDAAGRAPRLP
jgi:hypothetical protein